MKHKQWPESKQIDQNNSNKQKNQNISKNKQKEQQVSQKNDKNKKQQEENEHTSIENQKIKANVQKSQPIFKVDQTKAGTPSNKTSIKPKHKKNKPIISNINEKEQIQNKQLINTTQNCRGQSLTQKKQTNNQKQLKQSKNDLKDSKSEKQKIEQNQNQVEQQHNPQNQFNQNKQIVIMKEEQDDNFIDQNQFNNNDIKLQFNHNRLKRTVEIIKELQQNSLSAQKLIENQYKFYIQFIESKQELFQNYGIKHLGLKKELSNICNAIQKVRGDGNCFYYAFGYQFLTHLMFTYSENKFYDFIKQILASEIRFQITAKDFKIDDNQLEQTLLEEYLFLLCEMRKTNEELRKVELFTKFREFEIHGNGQGCFCQLSTIFFRNLSHFLLDKSPQKDAVFDRMNLLIWEEECDNNEVIIANLAEQLELYIKLIFFKDEDFNLREYGNQDKPEIILLIQPGHYNIGIKQ